MKNNHRSPSLIAVLTVTLLATWSVLTLDASADEKFELTSAVMCETIAGYAPLNTAVVFSIERSRVSCFTEFKRVREETTIYHNWYHRDDLITAKPLTIKPPRWSTFSSMQLRDADKGPWRVEITDDSGTLIHTLRFSITD